MTFPPVVHRAVAFIDGLVPSALRAFIRRTAPALSGKIYGGLARHAADTVEVLTIQTGPLANRQFMCSLRADQPYFLGNYEPELMAAFRAAVKPGDTVFDIGGHVGYSALVVATFVGPTGRVVVFEPHPGNRARLQQNLDLNPDLASYVSVEMAAVSDRVGTAHFDGESTTGHLDRDGIEVATTTIDHYVATHGVQPSVIKMDIEGAETIALPGARSVLQQVRPILLVEVHDEQARAALTTAALDARYTVESQKDGEWMQAGPWVGRELYRMVPR